MRVLLDEQLPRHPAREIGGHDVSTMNGTKRLHPRGGPRSEEKNNLCRF